MTKDEIGTPRDDTRNLFYHGYDNYMKHAFPEDELKPLSCTPQTRNRENPADIGLNDVLGNYSVTLVDSLSTLAILASDPEPKHAGRALKEFQKGVKAMVELYGDGSVLEGEGGEEKEGAVRRKCGSRACGFDLDSKVQVFETNIRGVGGLLSAHLFAIGELPIRGYSPVWTRDKKSGGEAIHWKGGFEYDGQLLRLAHDLASRLLPAFSTLTGLPYPRVNLRHGIPFYRDAEAGVCRLDGTSSDPREITETCAAGAGSLVLEFTTLSRLTGDGRFEELAKRAFWAVWDRRSAIGLVGGGIDAESGQWIVPPLAGIGAGIDSFFEYALKSSILLSGLSPNANSSQPTTTHSILRDDSPEAFLRTWHQAHASVKRHILRPSTVEKHPYYGQSDLVTGAPRYSWIDNLSAYYPGLLALSGEVSEAEEAHLLFTALWTRYSALPERWHAFNGQIDPNFKHWAGRPEFVESTWYLYQATKDPWYLHVGEMVLRDVRRRCWTRCGWAVLRDVTAQSGGGMLGDRMESFFLGETAKYLYLLFTEDHPLNQGDEPVVFSTEGHPLVIPKTTRTAPGPVGHKQHRRTQGQTKGEVVPAPTCPAPPPPLPLTVSHAANRPDLFHAAALTQLHLVPINPARSSPLLEASGDGPGIFYSDVRSPSNYTFYPWTLPRNLIPPKGTSSPIRSPVVSTLTFPNMNANANGIMNANGGVMEAGVQSGLIPLGALQKVFDGILINSLSNLRLNLVQEPKSLENGGLVGGELGSEYRVQGIGGLTLGRDEKVLVAAQALDGVSPADPHFRRVKDLEMVDLVVDVPSFTPAAAAAAVVDGHGDGLMGIHARDGGLGEEEDVIQEWELEIPENSTMETLWSELEAMFSGLLSGGNSDSTLHDIAHPALTPISSAQSQQQHRQATLTRTLIPAILPTGTGAAPLSALMDSGTAAANPATLPLGQLPFNTIFFLDSTLCDFRLPASIAKHYNILVVKRGDCSFGEKLANIPSFAPSGEGLQLVVVLSVPEAQGESEIRDGREGRLIRPLLDQPQLTPSGFERRHLLAMLMVDGGEETVAVFWRAAKAVGTIDGGGKLVVEEKKPVVGEGSGGRAGDGVKAGLGVKRRFWFESMGVVIGNLIML